MSKLDEIALEIELTLISLVEGFALQFLASSATPIVHDFSQWMFVPYIVAGVLFVLLFWSQSILHAVSFIRWPTRVGHMFLYFLASFVQVIAFGNLTDPIRWFFWCGIFSLIIAALYILDLRIIYATEPAFAARQGGSEFIARVEKRHRYELKTIVPAALVFNIGIWFVLLFSHRFDAPLWYAAFGTLQALISLAALWDSVRNFRGRAKLISSVWTESR